MTLSAHWLWLEQECHELVPLAVPQHGPRAGDVPKR